MEVSLSSTFFRVLARVFWVQSRAAVDFQPLSCIQPNMNMTFVETGWVRNAKNLRNQASVSGSHCNPSVPASNELFLQLPLAERAIGNWCWRSVEGWRALSALDCPAVVALSFQTPSRLYHEKNNYKVPPPSAVWNYSLRLTSKIEGSCCAITIKSNSFNPIWHGCFGDPGPAKGWTSWSTLVASCS